MQRILVVGRSQIEAFAPAWVRGLRQLGHDVHFFDSSQFFSHGLIGRIGRRFMAGTAIRHTNDHLQKTVTRVQPDIVLIHNGNPVRLETVLELRQKCWVAGYHHDDPFGSFGRQPRFRIFREAIPAYDSHHVIREENISDYRRIGVDRVKILQTYYVPWLHYPRSKDGGQSSGLRFDVVFIGHAERDTRISYITDMLREGVALEIFGSLKYWRRYLPLDFYKRLAPIEPRYGDAYGRTLSEAKICLAFFSSGNRDRYAYRVFEIPACGGFLLAERTDLMETLYEEGKEAEYFASSDEMVDKIRFYLRHDKVRQQIAQRGHERCLRSGYDVMSRMRQWILDTMEFLSK